MKNFFFVVGFILAAVALSLVSILFFGWMIMLAIGILAGSGVVASTIDFGNAAWLGLILSILVTSVVGGAKA